MEWRIQTSISKKRHTTHTQRYTETEIDKKKKKVISNYRAHQCLLPFLFFYFIFFKFSHLYPTVSSAGLRWGDSRPRPGKQDRQVVGRQVPNQPQLPYPYLLLLSTHSRPARGAHVHIRFSTLSASLSPFP
jgi:hypothetical protein